MNNKKSSSRQSPDSNVDLREQLVNGGAAGPMTKVSLPEVNVTSLRGILLDIDPKLFKANIMGEDVPSDPVAFGNTIIVPMLKRHDVLHRAHVRHSGTGLHVIIFFDQPVEIETDGDRQRWAGIVKVIQRLLPTDPDAPGITALTRPLGSINSKNGGKVRQLKKGSPVPAEDVLHLFEEIRKSPMSAIAKVLFGSDRVSPCPVCEESETKLAALSRIGKCYGSCGDVRLEQLYDVFLKPRPTRKKG